MSELKQHRLTEARQDELNDQIGLASADSCDPLIEAFKKNVIHDVLAVCSELRPSVDISVS